MLVRILSVMGAIIAFAQSAASAEDREHPLSFMFGEWRGTAVIAQRDGDDLVLTQTERVGLLLGGDIVAIEGVGYRTNGEKAFNAFAIVSPTGADGAWEMRSYNRGYGGTYPFAPTATGFVWSTPAGPNARNEYKADFADGVWRQTGHYVADGAPPRKFIDMTLERIGDTDWPAAGAVPASE